MDYINQIRGAAMTGSVVEQARKGIDMNHGACQVIVPTVGENIKARIKNLNEEARRLQVQYDAINGTAVLNMRIDELEKLIRPY
jgi:hypothetical protein